MIPNLIDFTRTFFAKHTILNILTRYCVFTSENMLMVTRRYQITATERILNLLRCIERCSRTRPVTDNMDMVGDVLL